MARPAASRAIGPRTAELTLHKLCLVLGYRCCVVETELIGKREDPVTLSSAVLGPASSIEEDPNKEPPLPHLMVPVDLRKGSSGEGYYPYSALVDSGATYNFTSQAVADHLSLEAARKRKPPPIATVNGEPLRATAVVWHMVLIRDSAGAKRSLAFNFVVADISHYDMIHGMAWLQ